MVERCILALTNPGDTILDPFIGSGTTAIAAAIHGRKAIGVDKDLRYIELAKHRLDLLARQELPRRQLGRPVRTPIPGEGVASIPVEWLNADLGGGMSEQDSGKQPGEEKAEENFVDASAEARSEAQG